MKHIRIISLRTLIMYLLVLSPAFLFYSCNRDTTRPPNFVIIYIDDLGYGDIEPFGSEINRTPNLISLAEEGRMFTSFYAATVCSPSRAALMTGCYPRRVGMGDGSWNPNVIFPRDSKGLNPDEITIAEILKEKGYATACFGKWHLGDQPVFFPTRQGFDTFLGIPYSNDMWEWHPRLSTLKHIPPPLPMLKDEKVVEIIGDMERQGQFCKIFTDAAVNFIRGNRHNPFFLYLPHVFVHHPRNARTEFMESAGEMRDWDLERMRDDFDYLMRQRTKAQIEELDWSVGEVIKTLREEGLADNTLVMFTSDNGGSRGCINTPLRGQKGMTWEGGMRVPTIFWWPGSIPAGTTCDEISSNMDILPTLASLAGGDMPDDRVIDGKDISAMLRGETGAKSQYKAFYYFRQDSLEAVRSGKWKLRDRKLYNLEEDIGEREDLAGANPDVVDRLNRLMDDARNDLGKPENCRAPGFVEDPVDLILESN